MAANMQVALIAASCYAAPIWSMVVVVVACCCICITGYYANLTRSVKLIPWPGGHEVLFAATSILYNYIIYNNYYYICQDGGAVGFVDFTKLSFLLSSLAQPFDQMGSIPEYVFVILSQRKGYAGRFQKETAGKRTGQITKWLPVGFCSPG